MSEQSSTNEEKVIQTVTEKIQNDGYSILGKKVVPVMLSALVGLIGIIYFALVNTDTAVAARVTKIENSDLLRDARITNMATNIYLICLTQKIPCVKPDSVTN